jgi:hypothetical protein
MVDNINLNRISPLLSSAERVKRVDRRQRDQQRPPFKGALKDEQKKKKKKKQKKGEDEIPSNDLYTRDVRRRSSRAVKDDEEQEKEVKPKHSKKIIDIRV